MLEPGSSSANRNSTSPLRPHRPQSSSFRFLVRNLQEHQSHLSLYGVVFTNPWLASSSFVPVPNSTVITLMRRVIDKYVGEIESLEKKHILRVDQEELETVIPQIAGLVRIVNGAYRGSNARLLAIDTDNFSAKLKIEKGIYDGKVHIAIDYEDICKLAQ